MMKTIQFSSMKKKYFVFFIFFLTNFKNKKKMSLFSENNKVDYSKDVEETSKRIKTDMEELLSKNLVQFCKDITSKEEDRNKQLIDLMIAERTTLKERLQGYEETKNKNESTELELKQLKQEIQELKAQKQQDEADCFEFIEKYKSEVKKETELLNKEIASLKEQLSQMSEAKASMEQQLNEMKEKFKTNVEQQLNAMKEKMFGMFT